VINIERLDLETRICSYIMNVEQTLEKIKASLDSDPKVREIVEIAEAYLKDSKHYLSRGDYFTALSTITYAEGLLDALRFLNILSFEWKRPSELVQRARTKVLTAGTFEIIHPGHLHYLRSAWRLGRVITVVSRDSTVRRIKRRDPIVDENSRLEVVSSIYYVHKARLGYEDDMLRVVEEERPDIILLGPDQPIDEEWLRRELKRRGIENVEILRLREDLQKNVYSTSNIIRRIIDKYSIQR